jgi:multidrug resistance efflux pump
MVGWCDVAIGYCDNRHAHRWVDHAVLALQVVLQQASLDGAHSTLKAAEAKALQDARHASAALEEAQQLHQAAIASQAEHQHRAAALSQRENDVRAAQMSLQSATAELQVR